jgi:hypothetical protein
MRLRHWLVPLLFLLAPPLAAQDTSAVKALAQRDSADAQRAYNASRSSTVRAAARRIQARTDSIYRALRLVAPVPPPPTPAVASVTILTSATSLGVGQTLTLSAAPKDASGVTLTTPVQWSAGPASVGIVSGTGQLTGVSAGTVTVTARADTVVASKAFSVTAPVDTTQPAPIDSTAGIAALPVGVPQRVNPACVTTTKIAPPLDLQFAINNAAPGTCILIAPGSVYVGNFVLPNKSGAAWITIGTDIPPPPARSRMTASGAQSYALAKIASRNYTEAIRTEPGAHHYRLTRLDIGTTPDAEATGMNMLVSFRNATGPADTLLIPHHLQIDQSYLHGTPTLDLRRLIRYDARDIAITDNTFRDAHSNNSDSQAPLCVHSCARVLIENNYLEAGHEVVMFGGGDPPGPAFSPSDIIVRRNHITRPPSWKGRWQVKNLIETKNVRRLLIEGNVIENVWADAQAGFAFVLKSENQDGTAPYTTTSDVTVRYNLIRHVASGFNLSGKGSSGNANVTASRFDVHDNLVDSLGTYGGDMVPLQLLSQATDVQVQRNTFRNGPSTTTAISFDGGAMVRAVIRNTVLHHGMYGVKGGGTGDGTSTLNLYAPGSVFTGNAIVAGGGCSQYPAGNTCPSTFPASSATLGVDMAKLTAAIAGVVVPDPLTLSTARAAGRPRTARPAPDPACQKSGVTPARCDRPLPMGLR